MLLKVSSVSVYFIQRPQYSFETHLHTKTSVYNTMLHTQAIGDKLWEAEKSINVMIDSAAGWPDLEQLCFPLTQRAKSPEVAGFMHLVTQKQTPTLTSNSHRL